MTSHIAWPSDPHRSATVAGSRRTSIRVSVQATDPLISAGLLAMLRSAPGLEIVEDVSGAEVVVAVPETDLHAVFAGTTARLVLIADDLRPSDMWAAIEHGLIVLVPRAEATNRLRLLRAVADAHEGRGDLPAPQLGKVLQGLKHLHENTLAPRELTLGGLSVRETEIIRLIADGMDTGEIAERMIYSERTVKNVLHSMLSRLNLRNRAHAVAYALRHDLI
ncbi:response regulator transcription factor [Lentzea sp. CA-135723]|uniref:helix-turn-helix transcriptional regulator n=1 Tax=Lentzea sp. CA-135723 TaxID=3239950 RepID=UPI003D8D2EE5